MDEDRSVAEAYGMIHPEASNTLTVRSVFIIDQQKNPPTPTYPAPTGRDLRKSSSDRRTAAHGPTSCSDTRELENGDNVIILPSVQDKDELAANSRKATKS